MRSTAFKKMMTMATYNSISSERYQRVLEGAANWVAFYRKNPDRFAEDYLHLKLRLFQRIILVMMFWSTVFVWIAARGQGKSFISAVYCVIRCILYPGTKVCVVSGTRGQASNVLEKIILELIPNSTELSYEIKETKMNGTNSYILFHNTSAIKVVTASDSSRGNRSNVLLIDEYRLVPKSIIDDVLRKFLTQRRMPRYRQLTAAQADAEYAKEKNLTLYLSSAYWKDHWSFTKCLDTFAAMCDPRRRQFICSFPYQLSIKEGLLDQDAVADEMSESDFSDIKFSMEMEALFYGSDENAFFDFASISKNRRIKYPMLPNKLASTLGNSSHVKIQPKQPGEVRILSADIALMSSKKHNNDATAIFINQLSRTRGGRYISNIVYADSYEGMRTDDQALIIRKLFDEYNCDYIVLDTSGLGLGVYDCLARDIPDLDTGEIYPALSCCNNSEMASRCTVVGAPKVIWAIKASAQFNSDCAFLLREGFRSSRIRLLETEYDAEEVLNEIRGYKSLNPAQKIKIQMPYIQTTLLIDELTKLQHEEANGKVKIYERSGMRKDRYSSLSYNYYVATQIENKLVKRNNLNVGANDMFIIKPPLSYGKKVSKRYGRSSQESWNG